MPGNLIGILFVLAASFSFSVNDLAFKLLSDTYPLHQILLVRSSIAISLVVLIIVPFAGGVSALKTTRRAFISCAACSS